MKYLATIIFFAFIFTTGEAVEPSSASALPYNNATEVLVAKKTYKDLNLTELQLANGMRVFLKPFDQEEDEVVIRFFAPGGYASFPGTNHLLAEAVVEAGWESGIGELGSDQRSVWLYERSIDLSPAIEAHYRIIDGSSPTEAIGSYLRLVKSYFTQHRFSETEFIKVVSAKNEANPQLRESERLNAGLYALGRELYTQSFSNPEEFVCIIVGDFSVERVEGQVLKTLATIPPATGKRDWSEPGVREPEMQVASTEVRMTDKSDCFVRMVFPVSYPLEPENIGSLKLACKIIERRLNDGQLADKGVPLSIHVQDEFPHFPSLRGSQIVLQYRCGKNVSDSVKERMIKLVARLQAEGPSLDEVEELFRKQSLTWQLCTNCSEFWLSAITNHALWGARYNLMPEVTKSKEETFAEVKALLNSTFREAASSRVFFGNVDGTHLKVSFPDRKDRA